MKHPWDSQTFANGARAAGRDPRIIAAANATARRIKRANQDLPVVLTLTHLAHLVDVAPQLLSRIIDRQDDPYRVFRVKKRAYPGLGSAAPRRYRTICIPMPALMRTQRWIAQNILNAIEVHHASYAFAPDCNLVRAAERHAGCSWLVKIDVRQFFEINSRAGCIRSVLWTWLWCFGCFRNDAALYAFIINWTFSDCEFVERS